jgi:NDP-sugar pyrophosphorylase family protein
MAAGYGTRMGNLTEHLPKPLLPLNGERIIEIILLKLARQGFERAVINLHYLPQKVKDCLGDGRRYGLELIYSEEPEILGSGGGIANAEKFFANETILVVNADTLNSLDIPTFYQYHLKTKALATMHVLPSQNNHDYTLVLYGKDHRLQRILGRDKPIPADCNSGIFTGYQILSQQARGYLKPENQSIITNLYLRGVAEGQVINVFPRQTQWLDIGTAPFYQNLLEQIQTGKLDLAIFK